MHKILFTVGLSNGETISEEKGNFCTIEGAPSPWRRLCSYIAKEGLEIRSLSLATRDGKRWNLPSAGKTPKFKEFGEMPKPVDFRIFRKLGTDLNPKTHEVVSQDLYTVAEATFSDGCKLQVWVDEETCKSWSVIVK